MAQTGFTPIQLYRSVTAATAPLAADLAAGELALNTTDEKLYFKNTGGTAKILANAAIAGIIPGTGVATALAVNVGSAGAPVINGGALGTPSSGTLTNATGLPAAGVTGTALVAAAIGTTVQAYDADLTTWAGITPGTGIGTALAVAVGTDGAPVIKSGALGTPSSGTVTNLTGTASININGTVGATTPTTGAFTSINGVTTDTTTNKPVTAASLAGGTLPASVTTLAASGFSILAGASFTSVDTIDCATSSLKLKGLSGTNMTITGPGDSTNRSVTFPAAAGTVVLSTTLNNGTLPASVTTLAASDTVTLTNGKVLKYSDVGFSRSTTATMFLGDGTAGDATGVLGATKLLLYPNAWANITNATSNVVQIGAGATTGYGGSLKLTNLEAVGALTAGSIIVTATAVPGANQAGIGLSTNYLQFVGGTTGTAINNHANSANLLGITNAGAVTIPGTLSAGAGITNTAGRSSFAATSEPYAIAAKYSNAAAGAVFFGATDATTTPGFQISNALGTSLLSGTTDGAITIPSDLIQGSCNGGPLAGFRNRIINGGFDVWQRGVSVTPSLGNISGYVSDRWVSYQGGAATAINQAAGTGEFRYCASFAGVASNTEVTMIQYIESSNCYSFTGASAITLSAWVYANVAKTITVYIDTANVENVFSATTNKVSTVLSHAGAGWQKLTLTYTSPDTTVQRGIRVRFHYPACTTGAFGLTGVQLEPGSVATPFEQRPYGVELALCQRYYESSWVTGGTPAVSTLDSSTACYVEAISTSRAVGLIKFSTPKRIAPTVTIYNYTPTAGKVSNVASSNSIGTTVTAQRVSDSGVSDLVDSGAGFAVGTYYWFGYTATAEL